MRWKCVCCHQTPAKAGLGELLSCGPSAWWIVWLGLQVRHRPAVTVGCAHCAGCACCPTLPSPALVPRQTFPLVVPEAAAGARCADMVLCAMAVPGAGSPSGDLWGPDCPVAVKSFTMLACFMHFKNSRKNTKMGLVYKGGQQWHVMGEGRRSKK